MKWCVFFTMILFTQHVYAHNVDIETRNENGELVIQVWLGSDPGEGVEVEILTQDGELRHSGQTQKDGILRWEPILEETLNISVYAEPGHEEELIIPRETISMIFSGETQPENNNIENSSHTTMPTTRNRQPAGNIVAGISLILAMAALWIACRNQKRIFLIEQELKNRER